MSANPSYVDEQTLMRRLLSGKTIAVVGLSPRPTRPSYDVARYLQQAGYRIVPVNPQHAGEDVLGEPCFATLAEAATTLAAAGRRIDLVDIFRRAEHVLPVVREAAALGVGGIWVQLGIVNDEAMAVARAAGILAVQDRCTKIEHWRLGLGERG
ncbi:CoA-binding protein [Ralstonia pseudosolanacearum]|uniref:CoA-binding protein n=1 Tax=Ralstonia pseudosolanacearum TaxID=1310165 RepID=UPI0026759FE0|nr:CoA-binding protein [Ralstonia pseudosolanacearum]MDO3558139.1 CoA-binding protein [Ralstonia pseudosolanacearum]